MDHVTFFIVYSSNVVSCCLLLGYRQQTNIIMYICVVSVLDTLLTRHYPVPVLSQQLKETNNINLCGECTSYFADSALPSASAESAITR